MIKKICLSLAFISLLSGCIPAVFVAGAGAGGTIVNDKRSLQTMITDRNIANTALEQLYNDVTLRQQTHVTVAAFNQIVLMTGEAPTPELRDRAYAIVSAIPKIKRIYNEVTLEPPTSSLAQTNDTWLTTKVKTAMFSEKGLSSGQIKVVTENGNVYLMGVVSQRQSDLAANVARQVEGVQKVVKIFEYD